MKLLYLDCFSGISGDMCLGSLIDAGVDGERLKKDLNSLPLHGWDMNIFKKSSHGITGTRAEITVQEEHQPHRSYADIKTIISGSPLPEEVKGTALNIFNKLASAEGKVHGVSPDNVHFHEVGGVDSILDIVGTALALHYLGVDKVVCSPLPPGGGTVRCRHGILPVPAPATAELLKGIPLSSLTVEGELVTPTGAAIAATLAGEFGPLPGMTVESVGYGFGSRDFGVPNFLRTFLGNITGGSHFSEYENILVLETNIDDMNPEFMGYIMDLLFKNGALDVLITPAYMKKCRPGYLLTVLGKPSQRDPLIKTLLSETSTLGVRWREEKRAVLGRRVAEVDTPYGGVRVKYALSPDGSVIRVAPEYEDCKRIAGELSIPIREVYESALVAARKGS
ncbi:MAG: nickel pincer cofactor biosynthesis protein LarC [Desulfocucumaceae bacterium]